MSIPLRIARATRDHFSAIRQIEIAAFETLRLVGAVHGNVTASSDDELQQYLDADSLFVALDTQDNPIGFGGAYSIDEWLHIGEVDVIPASQRRGVGRRIVETLLNNAREKRLRGSTLTTDRLAPFNAPFYQSLGFCPIAADNPARHLDEILRAEAEKGLDPLRRVAMVLKF